MAPAQTFIVTGGNSGLGLECAFAGGQNVAAHTKIKEGFRAKPFSKLRRALTVFVSYSQDFPARYRLLFSDPDIAAHGGDLEAAALRTFAEFAAIVQACQDENDLPNVSNPELTSLIYASVHGLIDLRAGGRMRKEKGLATVEGGVDLLLTLLSRAATPILAE